jgi:RNA polymerase sigma-70 factor (ECF subfamily)
MVTLKPLNRVNGDWQDDPDPTGWERWLAQHTPRLLLFARQQARCEADAQDLVQEAVLESWRRQGGSAPPALPLVFATIRLRAVDIARREDRRANREILAMSTAPECWFDISLENRERNRLIEEAMRHLPQIYREVVILKVWGELTFAEISEALAIPANTAASRYRYGLEELRRRTQGVLA